MFNGIIVFRIFPGLLIIGIVFISGCVQEKALIPVPNQSPTIVPTTQPSAIPTVNATQVSGATLIVDKNGAGNYTRIQDAINNSNNGDTILVYSGTYYESVDVDKQLILKGVDTGGGKPVVDANGSSVAIALSAGNSVVEGFKATGTAYYPYWYSAGILVNSNNNLIRNNTASNNYYGITLYHYSSNNTLIDNDVTNNNYWGILLYYSHYNRLIGNNASKNKDGGIYLYYSSNNTLSGNNVLSNLKQGIHLQSSWLYPNDNNTIIGNTASYNDVGISQDSSSNNTLTGNKVNSNNNKGIVLDGSNNNILSSNYVLKNNYGIDMNGSSNNTIYNNLFNNRENIGRVTLLHNIWNTTKQAGINIVGEPYLGGNYWANPDGIDFSVICSDGDHDGICDSPYTLDDNNSDYLPLAYKQGITDIVFVEDTDFNFSNKCEIQKIPRATNGSLLACLKAGGEKINVTFTGTAASVIYLGSPNGGIVKVKIDGREYPEINTGVTEETLPWTLENALRVIVQIGRNLPNTNHLLTFEIANKSTIPSRKQNEAGDIYIDAIEIRKE